MDKSPEITIVLDPQNLSSETLAARVRDSFKETNRFGVTFSLENMDAKEIDKLRNNPNFHIISAWVDDKFAGFLTIEITKQFMPFAKQQRGFSYIAAVDPAFTGLNISGILDAYMLKYAKEKNLSYCFRTTCASSKRHVTWVEWMGYKKWRFTSFKDSHHYSIYYRYDLQPSRLKNFMHKVRYAFSYAWCKLTLKSGGKYTGIGYVLALPIDKLKSFAIKFLRAKNKQKKN